jgi:hypothetical protein
MRILETPGFRRQSTAAEQEQFRVRALAALGRSPESQPSMAFGSPAVEENTPEDEMEMRDGSKQFLSVKIPAPVEMWCKRDDYPEGPVYTFLLPSEY